MTAWGLRCWGVDVPVDEEDPVGRFLACRPSSRWVVLGHHAAQSLRQLQTAWLQAVRQEGRESMVARSIDAEFLRYLAGTHHIAEAFRRTGLQSGDPHAWILYLPQTEAPNDGEIPTNDNCMEVVLSLGWSSSERTPSLSIDGMQRLGIDAQDWPEHRHEEACVAHVLMADDQSSSHR